MFDIRKAIGKYQGIPPYASELYGMYQPLLGLHQLDEDLATEVTGLR
jgi:hypothetical protein